MISVWRDGLRQQGVYDKCVEGWFEAARRI